MVMCKITRTCYPSLPYFTGVKVLIFDLTRI